MPKRNIFWIAFAVAAAVALIWVARAPRPVVSPQRRQLDPVFQTYEKIRERYYRDVSREQLQRGAVRGMVEVLDEFSSYTPPGEQERFDRRVMGRRQGLGLRLELADGQLRVIGSLFGSPAHRAGISPGDRILAINGQDVAHLPLREVPERLGGPSGTHVELRIQRRNGRVRDVTLTCAEFDLESVQGLCRNPNGRWSFWADPTERIAYVRVTEFVPDTHQRFRRVLRKVGSPAGLILDLRRNPGGLLDSAVELADLFIERGVIVIVDGRDTGPYTYRASSEGTLPAGLPLVVLIDAGTASAAEIVAGALRQNDRAVLIGTRTRGKGCVQSIYPLPGELGQVNLTTSEYKLADGRPITRQPGSDVWGVDPHVQVTHLPDLQRRLEKLWRQREVMPAPPAPSTAPVTLPDDSLRDRLVRLDHQLRAALEILTLPGKWEQIIKSGPTSPGVQPVTTRAILRDGFEQE